LPALFCRVVKLAYAPGRLAHLREPMRHGVEALHARHTITSTRAGSP